MDCAFGARCRRPRGLMLWRLRLEAGLSVCLKQREWFRASFLAELCRRVPPRQVLVVALFMVFPVCLFKDLRALRHLCYMGFFSVILLTTAVRCRLVVIRRHGAWSLFP